MLGLFLLIMPGLNHLPQSLQAEQSTLGAMLLNRDAIAQAAAMLTRDDFYRENHRFIFACILALHDCGEAVDVVTVSEELRARGQLDRAGGIVYIGVLIEACPSSSAVEDYARRVREDAMLRRMLS